MSKFVSLRISNEMHKFLQSWIDNSEQIHPYNKIEEHEELYHLAMFEFMLNHKEELFGTIANKSLNRQEFYDFIYNLAGKQLTEN